MREVSLAVGGALAALLLQTGDPIADVPGVTVLTYPVAGTTPDAIRAAIDAARPTDPNDGVPVDAITAWRIDWVVPGRGRRGCDLRAVRVRFSATVTLPRLIEADALAPEVRARWDAYLAAARAHEGEHVRDAYRGVAEVRRAIRAATCRSATAAGKRAVAAIGARAVALDAATDHGRRAGAEFP